MISELHFGISILGTKSAGVKAGTQAGRVPVAQEMSPHLRTRNARSWRLLFAAATRTRTCVGISDFKERIGRGHWASPFCFSGCGYHAGIQSAMSVPSFNIAWELAKLTRIPGPVAPPDASSTRDRATGKAAGKTKRAGTGVSPFSDSTNYIIAHFGRSRLLFGKLVSSTYHYIYFYVRHV